jgi:hypothetical protein
MLPYLKLFCHSMLMVFKNSVLGDNICDMAEEVTGIWGRLHKKESRDF